MRTRYDAELLPFISIVRNPGCPVISVPDVRARLATRILTSGINFTQTAGVVGKPEPLEPFVSWEVLGVHFVNVHFCFFVWGVPLSGVRTRVVFSSNFAGRVLSLATKKRG